MFCHAGNTLGRLYSCLYAALSLSSSVGLAAAFGSVDLPRSTQGSQVVGNPHQKKDTPLIKFKQTGTAPSDQPTREQHLVAGIVNSDPPLQRALARLSFGLAASKAF